MEVDKKKFVEAMEYIEKINTCDLKELELSDFGYTMTEKDVNEWKFVGLNNRDFIRFWVLGEHLPCSMIYTVSECPG